MSTENFSSNKTVLFYAEWCPACQKTKPIWNNVKSKLKNQVFEEINISNKTLTDAKEKEYGVNISSVPTILIIKNNSVTEYKGPKTLQSMTNAFA